MAIVTARGKRTTQAFLDQLNIAHHFDHIAAGQTVHRTKPHPAPIHWAAQQMGVSPQDCLMIGDTTVDILAGRSAGAQTIGVLSGFGEEAELLACGADLTIASVADLPDVLLGS
jgi:phosphoglycolate phosphatase